jgi:serine/threonine protein kinase
LDRTVAVKILPSHLSNDATLRQRFEQEAKAISSLNHPHICALYDVGHQDGTEFLIMEYLEGETLAKLLEKGPLPLAQVLKFGVEIADALDKAHRQGIVHRDLKPGNIMLTKSGAKLLDFGLAKAAVPGCCVSPIAGFSLSSKHRSTKLHHGFPRTGNGWHTSQMSPDATKSMCSPIPGQAVSGKSRRRGAPSQPGTQADGSSSIEAVTG